MANQLRGRVNDATNLFGIGAALGRYGQAGVANNRLELGGQGIQDLATQNAIQNLGGPLTSTSFQEILKAAQQGLQTNNPQAQAIMAALGVGSSGSAAQDYAGITGLANDRNSLLPRGLAGIFQAALNAERDQYLAGKSSAEITPAQYLEHLRMRGMI
jgi:hypothetical protein